MDQRSLSPAHGTADAQHAKFAIEFGNRASVVGEVRITSAGILAIGALMSSILLSTAVIVRAARQPRKAHGKII